MTYRGHVKSGQVVLDEPTRLPEGAEVSVEVASSAGVSSLGQTLLQYAGQARDLPADAARNHDHYLYGTPRQ
ncbi:MAG: hypothetical protein FJ395_05260 [Verrucomicrobia bacterium]|nr:hypothetical protein [Verrucomicrobiota bacterium]